MKPLYSKILLSTVLFISISILIIGTTLGISGLIIGGIVSIFATTILGISLMIHNSSSVKEPDDKDNTVVIIRNPIV